MQYLFNIKRQTHSFECVCRLLNLDARNAHPFLVDQPLVSTSRNAVTAPLKIDAVPFADAEDASELLVILPCLLVAKPVHPAFEDLFTGLQKRFCFPSEKFGRINPFPHKVIDHFLLPVITIFVYDPRCLGEDIQKINYLYHTIFT